MLIVNSNLKSLIKSLTINAIIPIMIEKKLLPYMIKTKFGRILNAAVLGKYGGSNLPIIVYQNMRLNIFRRI